MKKIIVTKTLFSDASLPSWGWPLALVICSEQSSSKLLRGGGQCYVYNIAGNLSDIHTNYTCLHYCRCMAIWLSPPSPEMRAHCSIGKATCLAFLPWPKQHASTFQLHVQVWTANVSSLLHHILLTKRETESSAKKQKCFSLSKKTCLCWWSRPGL